MAQHADFRARLYGVKANQLKGPANSARIRILKILPEWEKSPCRIWWRQLAWGIVPFPISIAPSPLAFGHIGMWDADVLFTCPSSVGGLLVLSSCRKYC